MDGHGLKRVLREFFEAQVLNHGDYSLVYGRPTGPGSGLVLGYNRTPLELVSCPVEVEHLPPAVSDGRRFAARLVAPIASIALANVATVADTGTGYQVQSVTGFRTAFEVDSAPRVPVGAASPEPGDGTVIVEQGPDAEDFDEFMGHFMDTLDAFYRVPDTAVFSRRMPASHGSGRIAIVALVPER